MATGRHASPDRAREQPLRLFEPLPRSYTLASGWVSDRDWVGRARTGSSVALLSLKSASDGTVNAEVASGLKHTAAGEADRPRFRLLQRDCWAAEVYAVAHPPGDRGRDERTSSAVSCPESRSRRTRLASQWH
jgi:hypothetical protein